jgi:lysophospholipase L1-like esterase
MKKILLLGDSITEAFNTKTYLPEYNIINRGIYGDNSDNLIVRLDDELKNAHADCAFILIGTNDFAVGLDNRQILQNIRTILTRVSEFIKPENVVLISILPTLNIENRSNERINVVNNQFMELSAELGTLYWDLNATMKDSAGQLISDYTIDGLHLSEKAYLVWAEQLRSFIKRLNNQNTEN